MLDGLAVSQGAEAFEGGSFEGFAVVGMGDFDHGLGALAEVLAVKVGRAVFGDDPMDMGAGRDDAGPFFQHADDARFAVLGDRREGDDRFPADGVGRAADVVHLSADAGVDAAADGVGADLAGDVHFDRAVDGGDFGVLADDGGVVDVADIEHRDERIVVDEVVESLGADHESGDDLAGVDLLLAAGDDALFDEVDEAVGEHFGVDAEFAVAAQRGKDGVRNRADAHLEGGAVFDQVGADFADLGLDFAGGRNGDGRDGDVVLDHRVDAVDVDEAVAVSARHVVIHLGDDVARDLNGGDGRLDRDAERAVAVAIGRGDVDEGDVHRHHAAAEHGGDFAEENRHVVGAAFVDGPAHVAADKEAVHAEALGHFGLGVRGRTFGVQLDNLHSPQLTVARGHRLDQFGRRGCHAVQIDSVVAFDGLNCLRG